MYALLAQAGAAPATPTNAPMPPKDNIAESLANLFSRIDPLADPNHFIDQLQQVPMVLAGVFIAVGLTYLLQGFRLYRIVVLIIALITGMVVGYKMGEAADAAVIVGVCIGVLMAVLAWPLMKYAVAMAGGVAGAFVGANCWNGAVVILQAWQINAQPDQPWIGALVGLLTLGFLSFVLFEFAVILFTSFSGSTFVLIGSMALLLQIDGVAESFRTNLANKPMILPLLVLVPAVVGVVLQQQWGAFGNTMRPIGLYEKGVTGSIPKPKSDAKAA